jgi:hypothetical protein
VPLSTIFQLYHGDRNCNTWRKPTTVHHRPPLTDRCTFKRWVTDHHSNSWIHDSVWINNNRWVRNYLFFEILRDARVLLCLLHINYIFVWACKMFKKNFFLLSWGQWYFQFCHVFMNYCDDLLLIFYFPYSEYKISYTLIIL